MERTRKQESEVNAIAGLPDAAVLSQLRELEQPVKKIVDQVAIYEKAQEDARYREILGWLSFIQFKSHHDRASEGRLPHSGEWLLNHDNCTKWREISESSIFLPYGLSGSGNTSLVSVVVDLFASEGAAQSSAAPVAYFYCSKTVSEPGRKDPTEILRSVVRQLSANRTRHTIHSAVVNEYECREVVAKDDGFDVKTLVVSECITLLLEVTASDPATIIIDAID